MMISMTHRRQLIIALASIIIATALTGCAPAGREPDVTSPPPSGTSPLPVMQAGEDSAGRPEEDEGSGTYIYTDSSGREVELPVNIERIAPTGPLAQLVLFSLCPDKLVGYASYLNDEQFEFIDEKYSSLPVFGSFYSDTLNLESVMLAAPQVIIDIGETKPNIADDMKDIEERTGIPVIFVHMEMDTILEAFETLGQVTGETEQARRIIEYIQETLTETERKTAALPESARTRVYYCLDDGLTAIVDGTVHSDVIDMAGGLNVAEVEASIRGGASMVSMEQLMLWNPDVILFAPESIYDTVAGLPEWQEIEAIRNGRFFEIPASPYNWMGRPASINRLLGIKWLSNLLYPDVFQYDMETEAREFYRLFYHCEITDPQMEELLAKSTNK